MALFGLLPSAPKAPDPMKTAQMQMGMNRDTAQSQQLMNMIDQSGPFGSTSYQQNGTSTYIDANGKTVTVPKYTQSSSFDPKIQGLVDSAISRMNEPFQFTNQDAADWAYDLASSRILPQQQQAQQSLQSRLINSGLRPGTAAWDREMTRMTNANTDQMNQLALNGRNQAFNEQLATRNQPLSELNSLLNIGAPTATNPATPQTSVGGVDYTGLVNQQYQAKMQNYQNQMGGLFGLVGTLGSAGIGKI